MDYFIGIDVSKKSLDVAVLKEGVFILEQKIDNTAVGVRNLVEQLMAWGLFLEHAVVCMEHTGIYNGVALGFFWKKGIRICLEPALRIKQSQGMQRGKTDKIDARRIAEYAYKNQGELRFWHPQRLAVQKLQAFLSLRERLIRVKIQLEVPLQEGIGYVDKRVLREVGKCREALAGLRKNLQKVEDQIRKLIEQDTSIHKQVKQITSVPGLGLITATNMIVTTQEFTRIKEAKKFACYAGVAPFEHRSGSSIKGRPHVSKLANMTMKTLLHLSAMAAIKSDGELRNFYQRKVASGKNKMSVLNAVRNKLISRAFVCVNNDRVYQKNYNHALA